MPRAANAKVWNDDLVAALEHRAAEASGRNSISQQSMWTRSKHVIQAVSAEIYMTRSTQMPKNLPNAGRDFPKRARDECEMIMRGTREVFPVPKKRRRGGSDFQHGEGSESETHAYASAQTPDRSDGMIQDSAPHAHAAPGTTYRHAYLDRMQYRGGGCAILLAFHHHPKPGRMHHYKDELIRDAQRYCDDVMEPNWFEGRTATAGWKSIESLERHRLVHRTSNRQARARAGWSGGPRDEFTITEEGRTFVAAMLDRWPELAVLGGGAAHATRSGGPTSSPSPVMSGMPMARPIPPSAVSRGDEEELLSWLGTVTTPGRDRRFVVSKARRKHLHRLVDYLRSTGRYALRHESSGDGANRVLIVTFEGRGGSPSRNADAVPSNAASSGAFRTPMRRKRPFEDIGGTDGSRLGGTPAAGSTADLRKSAFLAAEKRRREQEMAKRDDGDTTVDLTSTLEDESQDDDLKEALAASLSEHNRTKAKTSRVQSYFATEVLTVESDDDELKLALEESLKDASHSPGTGLLRDDHASVSKLHHGQRNDEGVAEQGTLRLLIDSRERTSNTNPRQLLNGLSKHLDSFRRSGRLGSIRTMRNCGVERRQLSTADFAWVLPDGYVSNFFVERKKISDLVGRSSTFGGIVHMEQMGRIRRTGDNSRGYLLLEGNLRQADRSVVNDGGDFTGPRVDSRGAIYDLAARLVVTGWSDMQIIHTLDHEGTARHLAQLSGIVASDAQALRPNRTLSDFNRTCDREFNTGDRHKFNDAIFLELSEQCEDRGASRLVADEVSSRFWCRSELEAEYDAANSEYARSALLKPLVACLEVGKEGEKLDAENLSKALSGFINSKTHSKTEATITSRSAPSPEKRRVHVSGSLSSLLSNHAGSDPSVVIEGGSYDDDQANLTKWADIQVREAGLTSHCFQVVVVGRVTTVDYVQSAYDENSCDWKIASLAATMMQDDLKKSPWAKTCSSHQRQVILFEGVMNEVNKRCRGGQSDDLGMDLRQRLRELVELAVAIVQHRHDGHVLSINDAQCVVRFLRSLVIVARDEALLYFDCKKLGVAGARHSADSSRTELLGNDYNACKVQSSGAVILVEDSKYTEVGKGNIDLSVRADSPEIIDLLQGSQESVIVLD